MLKNVSCKVLARLGVLTLRRPTIEMARGEGWETRNFYVMKDPIRNSVMVYHYCHETKTYRYDTHYDFLSKNEHFFCGGCGRRHETSHLAGFTLFSIMECWKVASSKKLSLLRFAQYIIFGLGKHLPEHRNGKTTGELEHEAMGKLTNIIWLNQTMQR